MYERVDIDNVVAELEKVVKNIGNNTEYRTTNKTSTRNNQSQGTKGDSFGGAVGIKSQTPIVVKVTNETLNGGFTAESNRIVIISSLTIVEPQVSFFDPEIKYINNRPPLGTHVKFTPIKGKDLTIKSGGDFLVASDQEIPDGKFMEFIFLSEEQTGIEEGAFVPSLIGTSSGGGGGGGGGSVTNPLSSDLDANDYNIYDASGYFLDEDILLGMARNTGAMALIAPFNNSIDFYINSLNVPIGGFTEEDLNLNIDLKMFDNTIYFDEDSNFYARYASNLNSLELIADTNATGANISMGVGTGSSARKLQIGHDEINIFDVLKINDENIEEIKDLKFNDGQTIQATPSAFEFTSPTNIEHQFYIGTDLEMEIEKDNVNFEGGAITLVNSFGGTQTPANGVRLYYSETGTPSLIAIFDSGNSTILATDS